MFQQAASFTTKIGKIVDLSKCLRFAFLMLLTPKGVIFGELYKYYNKYIIEYQKLIFLVEPKCREKYTASFYFSLTDHTHKELEEGQKDFHPGCARKFFGTKDEPLLEYKHEDLNQLPEQVFVPKHL